MTTPVIDVRPQYRISPAKTFRLVVKGVVHRLFRSVLTLLVIVLAMAFFTSLLTESLFTRAVARGVRTEIAHARLAARVQTLLFKPAGTTDLAERLAAEPSAAPRYAAFTGLPSDRMATLAAQATSEATLLTFFNGLDRGTRAVLVGSASGRDIFPHLAEASAFTTFVTGLMQLHTVRAPLPSADIQRFVQEYPAYQRDLTAATMAWNAAAERLTSSLAERAGAAGPDAFSTWLIADAAHVEQLAATLDQQHFVGGWSGAQLAEVRARLLDEQLRREVGATLALPETQQAWKEAFRANPGLDEKLANLDDPRAAKLLSGHWTADELARLSVLVRRDARLTELEETLSARASHDDRLLSPRQAFLLVISFVVCMVGIANAMLMAITERFREIATMKCLGATDGYILTQFLMEAGLQGLAGGVAGVVIGFVLSLAKCFALYGGHLVTYFPASGALWCGLAAIGGGVVLATLASIYPSVLAARMAPMDAMRVE